MQGMAMVVATIPVGDLERSKAFYGDTLGLTFLWENPASVRFACGGGSELSIFRRPATLTEHTVAHFEVADIKAAIEGLEANGVPFLDYDDGPRIDGYIPEIDFLAGRNGLRIAQIGPALGAWFRDPDGNTLGLRQG